MDRREREKLKRDGFFVRRNVFTGNEVDAIADALAAALHAREDASRSIRTTQGTVYAARNVTTFFPQAMRIWQKPPLVELLTDVLSEGFGLVRVLFFDKPPERSWTLPWHKDLTIAVERNDLPSEHFTHPTTKAGVSHVEAPQWLLEQMLTLRVHLDDVTEENGPLLVAPGSHRDGKRTGELSEAGQPILAGRGDVLAIRPLVSHSSHHTRDGVGLHRRILHFEFASRRELPDGYAWRLFQPASSTS